MQRCLAVANPDGCGSPGVTVPRIWSKINQHRAGDARTAPAALFRCWCGSRRPVRRRAASTSTTTSPATSGSRSTAESDLPTSALLNRSCTAEKRQIDGCVRSECSDPHSARRLTPLQTRGLTSLRKSRTQIGPSPAPPVSLGESGGSCVWFGEHRSKTRDRSSSLSAQLAGHEYGFVKKVEMALLPSVSFKLAPALRVTCMASCIEIGQSLSSLTLWQADGRFRCSDW
jgi:hypothetical protein